MPLALGILFVGAAVVAFTFLSEKAGAASASASAGGTRPAPTNTAGVTATAGSLMKYLEANGLTRVAAAGVVGNLRQESSLNPNAPGGGLAQWQAPRGPSSWTLPAQLDYLVTDLHTNYSGLVDQLNQAASPQQAAVLFQNGYEKPDPAHANTAARVSYANAAYQQG